MRRALPPSTTGQPTACAAIVSSSPNALVTGALSGSIECAATPANRPWASSVRNRRARVVAGGRPSRPNRAMASGCRGTDRIGARISGRVSPTSRTSGPSSRR